MAEDGPTVWATAIHEEPVGVLVAGFHLRSEPVMKMSFSVSSSLCHSVFQIFFKWTKDLNRHFPKEEIHSSQQIQERMHKIISYQRNAMKTVVRCNFTPLRIAVL